MFITINKTIHIIIICLQLFLCCVVIKTVNCNDNLRVAYQWNEIDFKYRNELERNQAIESKEFIPQNVIPVGLEVYRTRLFVTLPRWKEGVPASLAYIDINGKCCCFFFFFFILPLVTQSNL